MKHDVNQTASKAIAALCICLFANWISAIFFLIVNIFTPISISTAIPIMFCISFIGFVYGAWRSS